MHNKCGCGHHWGEKVLMVLVWVSGLIFFWTSLRMTQFWGYESPYFAWATVVLGFMGLSMKGCGCCVDGGKRFKMEAAMCGHDGGCKCGDCSRCC
jgi:hypothetical protein